MNRDKAPLYRKVNTRTHHVKHAYEGGEARWDRNTKATKANPSMLGSMHPGHQHGLDYTPLFRFLLSRVGKEWATIRSEAVARLDREAPLWFIVARSLDEERRFVRVGESSFFSGLTVDEAGLLAKVDPLLSLDDMVPYCTCCTHTLNGERFTRAFEPR